MDNFLRVHAEYIAKLPQGLQNRIARGLVTFYSTSLCQTDKTDPLSENYTKHVLNIYDLNILLKFQEVELTFYNVLDKAVNENFDNCAYKDLCNRQLLEVEILNFAIERKRKIIK